ncbi:uncharacterized protein LOC118114359 [Hippoglossus stenolepis]|uniref:uncharacterized protein LOC118114359 n=1 Tax=Hippoglossus stenolepis TaxID=195615 RepID=UPI001FAF8573|nr:uncharacterized protein LOC118114359 [Hippoglossus stenolepis]
MDSKPELKSTSAVSLNDRFSQILMDQLIQPRVVTSDPDLQQQRALSGLPPAVLLVKEEPSTLMLGPQASHVSQREVWCPRRSRRKRRSVWTRLSWQHVTRRFSTSRPRGFWSFMKKYRWRARLTSTCRSRHLSQNLQRGVASTTRLRSVSRVNVPTKRQLDAQLDEYMSMSRSRLDRQLDEYMSMSRSRLDRQLDEYMSMDGDGQWD